MKNNAHLAERISIVSLRDAADMLREARISPIAPSQRQ
jgi:hypothetical protein